MTTGEENGATIRRLLAAIRADRAVLGRRGEEMRRYADAHDASAERTAALALSLDRTYTALEAILERIARALEGGPPTGQDWHRALLFGAALSIDRVRPPILSEAVRDAANALRAFRHFLRHAYGADLDGSRVRALAQGWLSRGEALGEDLDSFQDFLSRLADQLESS